MRVLLMQMCVTRRCTRTQGPSSSRHGITCTGQKRRKGNPPVAVRKATPFALLVAEVRDSKVHLDLHMRYTLTPSTCSLP